MLNLWHGKNHLPKERFIIITIIEVLSHPSLGTTMYSNRHIALSDPASRPRNLHLATLDMDSIRPRVPPHSPGMIHLLPPPHRASASCEPLVDLVANPPLAKLDVPHANHVLVPVPAVDNTFRYIRKYSVYSLFFRREMYEV
jgi:hypothetical protein